MNNKFTCDICGNSALPHSFFPGPKNTARAWFCSEACAGRYTSGLRLWQRYLYCESRRTSINHAYSQSGNLVIYENDDEGLMSACEALALASYEERHCAVMRIRPTSGKGNDRGSVCVAVASKSAAVVWQRPKWSAVNKSYDMSFMACAALPTSGALFSHADKAARPGYLPTTGEMVSSAVSTWARFENARRAGMTYAAVWNRKSSPTTGPIDVRTEPEIMADYLADRPETFAPSGLSWAEIGARLAERWRTTRKPWRVLALALALEVDDVPEEVVRRDPCLANGDGVLRENLEDHSADLSRFIESRPT